MNAVLKGMLIVIATVLALFGAAPANASPDIVGATATCVVLNDNPTLDGVTQVAYAMFIDGYTSAQAAEAFAYAVTEVCPQHEPLVSAWMDLVQQTTSPVAKY